MESDEQRRLVDVCQKHGAERTREDIKCAVAHITHMHSPPPHVHVHCMRRGAHGGPYLPATLSLQQCLPTYTHASMQTTYAVHITHTVCMTHPMHTHAHTPPTPYARMHARPPPDTSTTNLQTCTHTCIMHACTQSAHMCAHACTHACTYACMHTHAHMHTSTHMHVCA